MGVASQPDPSAPLSSWHRLLLSSSHRWQPWSNPSSSPGELLPLKTLVPSPPSTTSNSTRLLQHRPNFQHSHLWGSHLTIKLSNRTHFLVDNTSHCLTAYHDDGCKFSLPPPSCSRLPPLSPSPATFSPSPVTLCHPCHPLTFVTFVSVGAERLRWRHPPVTTRP